MHMLAVCSAHSLGFIVVFYAMMTFKCCVMYTEYMHTAPAISAVPGSEYIGNTYNDSSIEKLFLGAYRGGGGVGKSHTYQFVGTVGK